MLTMEQTRYYFSACRMAVDFGFGGIFCGYFRSIVFLNLPAGRHFLDLCIYFISLHFLSMLFHCIRLILYPTTYGVHTTAGRVLSLIDYHNRLNEFLQWKHICYNLFRPQQARLPCYTSSVT